MRIFIAITAGAKLRESINNWQADHHLLPVRWVAAKNLHFTLIPPWQEQDPGKIIDALSSGIKRFAKFTLRLNHVTLGPHAHAPRLIWAVGPTSEKLLELKALTESLLQKKPVRRPLKTHITLARFTVKDYTRFPSDELNESIRWQQQVGSISIMESSLRPSGADYTILREIKF